MTTPRPHAELATRYFADDDLKCWFFYPDSKVWIRLFTPSFDGTYICFVGHEKPTAPPRPMCTLGGLKYPMPETVAPKRGTICWCSTFKSAYSFTWSLELVDTEFLELGLVHLDHEAATLHSKALQVANMQAIAGAR